MSTLKLRLSFTYTLFLSPQHELTAGPPILDLWITQTVSSAFHTVAARTAPAPTGEWSGEVRDRVFEFPISAAGALDTLGTARLMVHAYSRTMNHHGEQCYLQAGCSRVALAELVSPDAAKRARRLSVDLVFPMLADDPVEGVKGRIEFDVAGCAIDRSGHALTGIEWRIPELALSPLEAYIEHEELLYGPGGIASTWSFFDNVNLFRFVSEVGVLPAAAYIASMIAATHAAYYRNAALVALAIMGLTEEDALTKWDLDKSRDDCRHAAYWLAQVLSLYVQACDYVSDEVVARQRNGSFRVIPVEWFQQTRVRRGAMDCEDGAMETMVEALELMALKTDDPLLLLLQRVKSAFYTVLLLDGVSGAEINLQASPSHLDAHMNSALVNKAQFCQWTRGTLAAEHCPDAATLAAASLFPPVVMMEGTGPLDPNGVEHATADEYAEEMLETLFSALNVLSARLRREFHYDSSGKRQSGFYKAAKIMSTAELADTGVYLWVLGTRPKRGQRPTAGISFQDMAAASPNITAMPETPLTAEQTAVMRAYMADLHPQPILVAPGDAPDSEQVLRARAQVEELRVVMARIIGDARIEAPSSGKEFRAGHQAVRIAKYAHFDDQRMFLRALVNGVSSRHDLNLVAFDAQECQATPERGFFRLRYSFAGLK